ncbi:MAG: preprotein translocase subunit YajC [Deltaproteobacteria bacterium]|nr:preprotein translocase subunit YajC [Deltaproteobacteria bacterium]
MFDFISFDFASTAYAAAPPAAGTQGNSLYSLFYNLFPLLMIFVVLYFAVFLPQQKRTKIHREMLDSLKKGDKVKTDGGIHGSIQKITDSEIELEISPKVVITLDRQRVADRL